MPGFTLTASAAAPVEEVWKLLFDPARFPEWWAGVGTARVDGTGAYTIWPVGDTGHAMPQRMRAERTAGRITMSCQVNEIDYAWQLTEDGDGTGIIVRVAIAPAQAHQLDQTQELMAASLPALVALAESGRGEHQGGRGS
jgi:uncharacterized protein YndB with AHSA1/START domain